MRLHRIADEPRIAHDLQEKRNQRLDRRTEEIDHEFQATKGTTWRPLERMVWSRQLRTFVWWRREYSGKWVPKGISDRVLIRKLRAEMSNNNRGLSVEEILDSGHVVNTGEEDFGRTQQEAADEGRLDLLEKHFEKEVGA